MPKNNEERRNKGLTGLAKHGSVVSLAPARALSSHARRIYRDKYRNNYKYPRWIFAFDSLLIGIVAILLAFNLSMFLKSYKSAEPGLALDFKAPTFIAADETPLELDVRSTDGKQHDGVKIEWQLPEWVEIVQAAPRVGPGGSVDLGSIRPGEIKSSRLLVRIRARAGSKVQIGFVLTQYDPLFIALDYSGSETRLVERSALSATAVFGSAAYAPGTSVPIIVSNDGRLTARAVTLRLTKREGATEAGFGAADYFNIGDMAPGERQLVYVWPGQIAGSGAVLGWDLQDGAQTVESVELKITSVTNEGVTVNNTEFGTGGVLRISYSSLGAASIWVSCDSTSVGSLPWTSFEINQGNGNVVYNGNKKQADTVCQVFPVDEQTNSVGKQTSAVLGGGGIPFSASARYYGTSGDQLGVGSLPPRVGEKTTYWIIWSVGPSENDLSDVEMRTVLPSGVAATGKFASATPGSFKADGSIVTWDVPTMPLGGGEKSSFAFEIEVQPTTQDIGKVLELIGPSSITAKTKDDLELKAETNGDNTNIHSDELGNGKGTVIK